MFFNRFLFLIKTRVVLKGSLLLYQYLARLKLFCDKEKYAILKKARKQANKTRSKDRQTNF